MRRHLYLTVIFLLVGCVENEQVKVVDENSGGYVPVEEYIKPSQIKVPEGYSKVFSLNGRKASYFLQLDPYCGEGALNFTRADFDGNGTIDEIGWYVLEDKKTIELGCRFFVESPHEKYLKIDDESSLITLEEHVWLGRALGIVKKGEQTSNWEERKLNLSNDAVEIYNCEKSAFILYWDNKKEKFEEYWTAD